MATPTCGPSRRASTRSSSSAPVPAGSRSPTGSSTTASSTPSCPRTRRRRHVPPLAVLPAAALVDQAVRAGRGADSREYQRYDWNSLIAVEPELRSLQAEHHGRLVVLPVAARDGGQPRASFAEQGRDRRPLRLPLGAHAARRRPRRHDVHRSRPRTASTARRVLVLAVGIAEPWSPKHAGDRARAPLRGDARRRRRTRASGCSSSASRTRASSSPRVSRPGRRRSRSLAVARQDLGPDEVAGRRPGALRAAVRGQLPRPRGLDPRRLDRRDRATSSDGYPGRAQADRQRRGDERRCRRGHRRDRVHLPAAGPDRARGDDVRRRRSCRP